MEVGKVGRDGAPQTLLGGVDDPLGVVLAPLALRLVQALLEVDGGICPHLLWDGHAVHHCVTPAAVEVHGGFQEHNILAAGLKHLQEALLKVADLCPHVVVRGARGRGVLGGHYLAVAWDKTPGGRQHEVRALADGNGEVLDALPSLAAKAEGATVLRALHPLEVRHLAGLCPLRLCLTAAAVPPVLVHVNAAIIIVLLVHVKLLALVSGLPGNVGGEVPVDVPRALILLLPHKVVQRLFVVVLEVPLLGAVRSVPLCSLGDAVSLWQSVHPGCLAAESPWRCPPAGVNHRQDHRPLGAGAPWGCYCCGWWRLAREAGTQGICNRAVPSSSSPSNGAAQASTETVSHRGIHAEGRAASWGCTAFVCRVSWPRQLSRRLSAGRTGRLGLRWQGISARHGIRGISLSLRPPVPVTAASFHRGSGVLPAARLAKRLEKVSVTGKLVHRLGHLVQ
mmetsp:Transcript_19617/g.54530  ORF Transcript_19617/g.54530 Transcript_19617/m.54530 type:complete len:451 (-) Transcript_19617:100-1452(-)